MRNEDSFFRRTAVDWLREAKQPSILQHTRFFKGGGQPAAPAPTPPPSINVARQNAAAVVNRKKSRGYGSTVLTQLADTLG